MGPRILGPTLFFLCAAISGFSAARPFIPASDEQVLERFYRPDLNEDLLALTAHRQKLKKNPTDLNSAVAVAEGYIRLARSEGDPRYVGYAQAALKTWEGKSNPPESVLVLRAVIHQMNHDFVRALSDLDKVLERNSRNTQAWLIKASIFQAQGRYAEAKDSCRSLLPEASLALVCGAAVDGLNGNAEPSYQALVRTRAVERFSNRDQKIWVLTILADNAKRRGDAKTAETHFLEAMTLGRRSIVLLNLFADFLLDQDRPKDVLKLVGEDRRVDSLLLKAALARERLNDPDLGQDLALLEARFESNALRADSRHLREEAIFTLHLKSEPSEALILAEKNWAVQKEPEDARILLEAAMAANEPEKARPVLDWLKKTKLEDVRISALVRQIEALPKKTP